VTRYYGDYGFRPIHGLHVLVHPPDVPTAMTLLRESGWRSTTRAPEKSISSKGRHICLFQNASGRQITLHWRLFRISLEPDAEDILRDAPQPITLGTLDLLVLNPTSELLDVCASALRWNVVPPVQWVADAMMILESPGSTIDWSLFVTSARQATAVLSAREALHYVRDRFGATVPPDVLERLDEMSISDVERSEYRKRTRRPRVLRRLKRRGLSFAGRQT
jgi:hypothetical protein